MKLWECQYTLDNKLWTDKVIDYWSSTSPTTIDTIKRFWEKIHPGWDTVSDFTVRRAELTEDEKPQLRIVERIYK
jgi:hypothetical protein